MNEKYQGPCANTKCPEHDQRVGEADGTCTIHQYPSPSSCEDYKPEGKW
jgi:hypothetical protein